MSTAVILFLPSGLSAFAIKWGQYVHQDITLQGLNPLGPVPVLQITAPKFELTLDTGNKVAFSNASIAEITEHNVSTDELQGGVHKRLHFDSEDLAGGSDRLERLRQNLVLNLVDPVFFDFTGPQSTTERQVRVDNSRAILGRALHTLQDFYAHTNWVERHGFSLTEINTRLGNAIEPSPDPSSRCDSSQPASAPLTSGWFLDDGPLYCGKPDNKCAHGGAGCGIHKDFISRTGFASASALATKATSVYTQQTLQAVLSSYTRLIPTLGEAGAKQAVRLAVCEFMGVPDAFSTCLTSNTVTVQKLNKANGQSTLEGLVQSSGDILTPAIDCGLVCQGTAITGKSVALTASDVGDWRFVRWSEGGVCPGSTNPQCTVTVDGNKLARPEFAPPATLTVQRQGLGGMVRSTGGIITPAIDCGAVCQGTAVAGTEVQLTASDSPPWIFVRWDQGGACAGSSNRNCTITLNSNQTARAVFEEKLPIPLTAYSTSHSCYLEIYARQYNCDGSGESDSSFVTYQGELGADYGGTPQSGGGIANIRAEGQVNVQPGFSSIRTVLDGEATGQWFARGQQSAAGSFSTTVYVTSDTLPSGTPVNVRVTFHFSSQHSLSAELSEPPISQWSVAPFILKAYAGAYGYQGEVLLGSQSPANESLEFSFQSQVGSGININVGLHVAFQWMEISRATVREEINASVDGPYITETGGLNVRFIQN